MRVTTLEVIGWFVAHLLWWGLSAFLIYPFVIAPFQLRYIEDRGLTLAAAGGVFLVIGFVVALVSAAAMLLVFLAIRNSGPRPTATYPLDR